MEEVIFFFTGVILWGIASCQSIIASPSDATGIIGGTAQFDCDVQFGGIDAMVWKVNNYAVYSYFDGVGEYFRGADKYSVVYEGGHFTLNVKNLEYTDGGIYECAVALESAPAVLIVLGAPQISRESPHAIEDRNATYKCITTIGGPRKEKISKRHYPTLSMLLQGDVLEAQLDVNEIQDDQTLVFYHLRQLCNISLTASLHGGVLSCEIRTHQPSMYKNTRYKLNVSYSVRNISYHPEYKEYDIGTIINCTADGNPPPYIHWQDISNTDDGSTSSSTKTQVLKVTGEMKGRNSWMCTAHNTIKGQLYTQSKIVHFSAGTIKSETEPGKGTWPIAVGVVISLLLTSAIIVGLAIFKVRKKCLQRPIMDDEDPISALSLLEYQNPVIDEVINEFILDNDKCKKISEHFLSEIEKGLSAETDGEAPMKVYPSYVRTLPDRSESGEFLVLTISGGAAMITLVILQESGVSTKPEIFPIKEKLNVNLKEKLFNHIAKSISAFMESRNLQGENIPLAFIEPGVVKNEALDIGKWMNKKGESEYDVTNALHGAVQKQDVPVSCVAILSSQVSKLMSCAYDDDNCQIGVILCDKIRLCYMEKIIRVGTWNGDSEDQGEVIMNVIWQNFGDKGELDFVRTSHDKEVDKASKDHGCQLLQKMIGINYLKEIIRHCLGQAIEANFMLEGNLTEDMARRNSFSMDYVIKVMKDPESGPLENTSRILEKLGYKDAKDADCRIVYKICNNVVQRAADLASCAIASLINRINKPDVTVAVHGSLYVYIPKFHDFMVERISSMITNGLKFQLKKPSYAWEVGAALVAAQAVKMKQKTNH